VKIQVKLFRKLYTFLILCSLLTLSFCGYAVEPSQSRFNEIIGKIENLHQSDLLTAIKLAKFHQQNISDFTIEQRIRFKKLQAELYTTQMDYGLVKTVASEGLNLTKTLTRPSINMAELLNLRGYAYDNFGESDLAMQDYISALEIAKSLENDEVVIMSLTQLGSMYWSIEEFERSLILLNEALFLAQKINNDKYLGIVYFELGTLYAHFDLESKVKGYFNKAYDHFIKAGEEHLSTSVIPSIAITHAVNQEFVIAISLFEKIIIKAKETGNYYLVSNIYSQLAEAYLKKPKSDPHAAYKYILKAEKYLDLVNEASSEILFKINKAEILMHLEEFEEAMDLIRHAEKMLSKQAEHIHTHSFLQILRIKSELLYKQGKYKEAHKTQNQYHESKLEAAQRINLPAIEELRIEYESKQHEAQAEALETKRFMQQKALKEVNDSHQERSFYITVCIFTLLSLAWFYSISLKNRKILLDTRGADHLTDMLNRQNILVAGSTLNNDSAEKEFTVMLIKVDNLTNINQVKGYDISNNVLIESSQIIMNLIGKGALCGRYSSDTFIVFLSEGNSRRAERLANEIHNTIYGKSWDKYGLKVVSVSIGISHRIAGSSQPYELLIKTAKELKQQAVISGGNTVCM